MTQPDRRLGRPLAVASAGFTLVAVLGGLATDIGPWYRQLTKPSFQPPDWLFGPAWTLIYALTAYAAADAWRRAETADGQRSVIVAFSINGALNFFWSVLFFTIKRPDWALIEVVALWASIVWLIVVARSSSITAAWLLVPYLAWVTFASLLNLAVVKLNAPF